jgi:hypothetical protein
MFFLRTIEFILNNHAETLNSLCVNGRNLDDYAFKNLVSCKNLKTLSIKRGNNLTHLFFTYVNKLSSLESLSFIKFNRLYLNLFNLPIPFKKNV